MLTDSINNKIDQSRGEMHETHNPIFNQSLLIEIQALEWVQLQIEHLVNSTAEKRNKLSKMNNNNLNTVRAPNIKADSPEVKEIIDFAEGTPLNFYAFKFFHLINVMVSMWSIIGSIYCYEISSASFSVF